MTWWIGTWECVWKGSTEIKAQNVLETLDQNIFLLECRSSILQKRKLRSLLKFLAEFPAQRFQLSSQEILVISGMTAQDFFHIIMLKLRLQTTFEIIVKIFILVFILVFFDALSVITKRNIKRCVMNSQEFFLMISCCNCFDLGFDKENFLLLFHGNFMQGQKPSKDWNYPLILFKIIQFIIISLFVRLRSATTTSDVIQRKIIIPLLTLLEHDI